MKALLDRFCAWWLHRRDWIAIEPPEIGGVCGGFYIEGKDPEYNVCAVSWSWITHRGVDTHVESGDCTDSTGM